MPGKPVAWRFFCGLLLLPVVAAGFSHGVSAATTNSSDVLSSVLKRRLNLGGYFSFETAYRYLEPRSVTKMRGTFFNSLDYSFSDRFKLRASAWYYYDVAYDLFDYDTIAARFEREEQNPLVFVEQLGHEKDSPRAELREMYLNMLFSNMDIRLGLQHVVWGVLEGVRVVDEINPMNFRELILLDDILDYRIPLWTAKLDWYTRLGDWQFLLIPDLTFHKPAPRGSEWELFQNVPNTVRPQSNNPRNWEIGLRWSKNLLSTDLTLSYLYTWDDFPSIFRHVSTLGADREPTMFPTYNRVSMLGTTFSRQMLGTILKGEFAYVTGKFFGINQADANHDGFLDNNGEVRKDHIRWGLGFEVHVAKWDIAPSYVQWQILDYDEAILQNEEDDSVNVYMRRKFRTGNSTLTMLWIYLVDMRESYYKPRVSFAVSDRFRLSVGFDIFSGHKTSFGVASRSTSGGGPLAVPQTLEQRAQFFGNFGDNDRAVVEMRYTF